MRWSEVGGEEKSTVDLPENDARRYMSVCMIGMAET